MNWAKGGSTGGRGSSFKGSCDYVLHDKKQWTSDRVGEVETLNLATSDPKRAWREMQTTVDALAAIKARAGIKQTGRKNEQPVYAVSLNWHADDQPDSKHMMTTARKVIGLLGLADHQALIAEHRDLPRKHVHIIVNLVHPETGKTAQLYRDEKKLDQWAHEYELGRNMIRSFKRAAKFQERTKVMGSPEKRPAAGQSEVRKVIETGEKQRRLLHEIRAERATLAGKHLSAADERKKEIANALLAYRREKTSIRELHQLAIRDVEKRKRDPASVSRTHKGHRWANFLLTQKVASHRSFEYASRSPDERLKASEGIQRAKDGLRAALPFGRIVRPLAQKKGDRAKNVVDLKLARDRKLDTAAMHFLATKRDITAKHKLAVAAEHLEVVRWKTEASRKLSAFRKAHGLPVINSKWERNRDRTKRGFNNAADGREKGRQLVREVRATQRALGAKHKAAARDRAGEKRLVLSKHLRTKAAISAKYEPVLEQLRNWKKPKTPRTPALEIKPPSMGSRIHEGFRFAKRLFDSGSLPEGRAKPIIKELSQTEPNKRLGMVVRRFRQAAEVLRDKVPVRPGPEPKDLVKRYGPNAEKAAVVRVARSAELARAAADYRTKKQGMSVKHQDAAAREYLERLVRRAETARKFSDYRKEQGLPVATNAWERRREKLKRDFNDASHPPIHLGARRKVEDCRRLQTRAVSGRRNPDGLAGEISRENGPQPGRNGGAATIPDAKKPEKEVHSRRAIQILERANTPDREINARKSKPEIGKSEIQTSRTPEIGKPDLRKDEKPKIEAAKKPEISTPELPKPEVRIKSPAEIAADTPDLAAYKPPEVKPLEVKAPGPKPPEVKFPEIKPPEVKVPETKAPEVKVPEVKVEPPTRTNEERSAEFKARWDAAIERGVDRGRSR